MDSNESKNEIIKDLQESALKVLNEQKLLEKNEAFKAMMLEQKRISTQMEDLKKRLKEEMVKFGIKEIISPKGKEDWKISVSVAKSVSATDLDSIDDKYKLEEELDTSNIVVKNGSIYQIVANTKQVKNEIEIGMDLPKGFIVKNTPRISIKVDGKTV